MPKSNIFYTWRASLNYCRMYSLARNAHGKTMPSAQFIICDIIRVSTSTMLEMSTNYAKIHCNPGSVIVSKKNHANKMMNLKALSRRLLVGLDVHVFYCGGGSSLRV